MAQIIELLGDFPLQLKMGGKFSRELFDHTGMLSSPLIKSYSVTCPYRRPSLYPHIETVATHTSHGREVLLL